MEIWLTDYIIEKIEKFGLLGRVEEKLSCYCCGRLLFRDDECYGFDRFSRVVCDECRIFERTEEL